MPQPPSQGGRRFESLWVTFPAACGVSPGHDPRLRQEARTGLPEATREPPIGALLITPPQAAGILFLVSYGSRLGSAHLLVDHASATAHRALNSANFPRPLALATHVLGHSR